LAPSIVARVNGLQTTPKSLKCNDIQRGPIRQQGALEAVKCGETATPIGGVSAAFANDAPYVIAKIEMDGTDGLVIMISNVVNCPWEDVYVGMHVRVTFDDLDARMTLPKFAPV